MFVAVVGAQSCAGICICGGTERAQFMQSSQYACPRQFVALCVALQWLMSREGGDYTQPMLLNSPNRRPLSPPLSPSLAPLPPLLCIKEGVA